jgi:hypothetical protein
LTKNKIKNAILIQVKRVSRNVVHNLKDYLRKKLLLQVFRLIDEHREDLNDPYPERTKKLSTSPRPPTPQNFDYVVSSII